MERLRFCRYSEAVFSIIQTSVRKLYLGPGALRPKRTVLEAQALSVYVCEHARMCVVSADKSTSSEHPGERSSFCLSVIKD